MSEEEIATENKYYFGHNRDLIYAGLRVDILLAFLSSNKVKSMEDENVFLKSPEDLRKYGDAIRWGAEMAGHMLSPNTITKWTSLRHRTKKNMHKQRKMAVMKIRASFQR